MPPHNRKPCSPPSLYGPVHNPPFDGSEVLIAPGANIQTAFDAHPTSTRFRFQAGTHPILSSKKPKSGCFLIGEFGAILDGTGWVSGDNTDAAIRAHNDDIDNVTVQNLVIQHCPYDGVRAYKDFSSGWNILSNELCNNLTGVELPDSALVQRNYIHHNIGDPNSPTPSLRGGGYSGNTPINVTFVDNHVAYNGPEQKLIGPASGHVFRTNWFDHGYNGIWFDGDHSDILVEGNLCEDQSLAAIFHEISSTCTIRNNTIRRALTTGIFISTSKNVTLTGNTIESCLQGINFFVNIAVVGGPTARDLSNNLAQANTVRPLAGQNAVIYDGINGDTTPYSNGSKNNLFVGNHYFVPVLTDAYWSYFGVNKTFAQWQAIPQDATGSVGL